MRPILRLLVLTVLGLGAVGLPAAAQPPWDGPPWVGNYDPRAYRQFLTSPSPYRTYLRLTPSYSATAYSPFGYQTYYSGPGYLEQRITPWGFENYSVVPGYGGYAVYPYGFNSYYVPGYTYQYYLPAWPPR
ncbi:MAG TPA: hypothetical protein VNK04_16265 [Gemmataceae bacterium]|jgi:hypothetical protein|nr:hypothetical protein [Gemmataceae bacterium]